MAFMQSGHEESHEFEIENRIILTKQNIQKILLEYLQSGNESAIAAAQREAIEFFEQTPRDANARNFATESLDRIDIAQRIMAQERAKKENILTKVTKPIQRLVRRSTSSTQPHLPEPEDDRPAFSNAAENVMPLQKYDEPLAITEEEEEYHEIRQHFSFYSEAPGISLSASSDNLLTLHHDSPGDARLTHTWNSKGKQKVGLFPLNLPDIPSTLLPNITSTVRHGTRNMSESAAQTLSYLGSINRKKISEPEAARLPDTDTIKKYLFDGDVEQAKNETMRILTSPRILEEGLEKYADIVALHPLVDYLEPISPPVPQNMKVLYDSVMEKLHADEPNEAAQLMGDFRFTYNELQALHHSPGKIADESQHPYATENHRQCMNFLETKIDLHPHISDMPPSYAHRNPAEGVFLTNKDHDGVQNLVTQNGTPVAKNVRVNNARLITKNDDPLGYVSPDNYNQIYAYGKWKLSRDFTIPSEEITDREKQTNFNPNREYIENFKLLNDLREKYLQTQKLSARELATRVGKRLTTRLGHANPKNVFDFAKTTALDTVQMVDELQDPHFREYIPGDSYKKLHEELIEKTQHKNPINRASVNKQDEKLRDLIAKLKKNYSHIDSANELTSQIDMGLECRQLTAVPLGVSTDCRHACP